MTNADILAPHLDDAVLSCWHQIEAGTRVITLFAGTPENSGVRAWDRMTTSADPQETLQSRIAENAASLQDTPSTAINLPYLDFQYKHPMRNADEIASTVLGAVDDFRPIIAAAGIGKYFRQHPDHITTRKVAESLLARGLGISFYVDLPYMLPVRDFNDWPERLPKERIKKVLGMNVEIESHELSTEQQQRKIEAVKAFKSQLRMVNALAFGALAKPEAFRWEATIKLV